MVLNKNYIILILIFNLCCSHAYSSEWHVMRNHSIRIFYMDGYQTIASETITNTMSILEALKTKTQLSFRGEVNIFLAKDRSSWEKLTHDKLPNWSNAVTKPELGIIYILYQQSRKKKMYTTLRHELFHVLIGNNFSGDLIPRWFEEGAAMLYAGERFSDYASTLSKANLTKSLLTLDEIERVLKFQKNKANLAYAQSYLGVKMIVDALGWEGIRDLLVKTRQNQDWNHAFFLILQMDKEQFEWKLFKYIEDNYKWSFIFQSEMFLWVILPFVVIMVFILIRLRNYRTVRQWEYEDQQTPNNLNLDD